MRTAHRGALALTSATLGASLLLMPVAEAAESAESTEKTRTASTSSQAPTAQAKKAWCGKKYKIAKTGGTMSYLRCYKKTKSGVKQRR